MAIPTLERIIALVDALSPEEKRQLRNHLDTPPRVHLSRDAERIRELRGAFKHLPTSSEEFARRKQEEIDLEERKFKRE